jgi:transposase-like protein
VPKTRPAYQEEFRRESVQMLRAGRTPRELSESLGVPQQTLTSWRRQDQLDTHTLSAGPDLPPHRVLNVPGHVRQSRV